MLHWHSMITVFSWHHVVDFIWLIFLLIILWYFGRDWFFFKKAQSWPLTKGQVTHLEWAQQGSYLWPHVEYSYDIAEVRFTNERFFLDTFYNTSTSNYARKIAYKAATAYLEKKVIDVFYNPENPQQAALDITIPKKLTFITSLILCLFLFHLGKLLYYLFL